MSAVMPGAMAPSDATMKAAPMDRAAKPALTALDRLVASRARLRGALLDIANPPPKPHSAIGQGLGHIGDALLARLRAIPGASLIVESVQSWWEQHPLRAAGSVAQEATRSVVLPIARQHPYTFVGAAAIGGALLGLTRPWRWLIRPALLVGVLPQILVHVVKRMPAASWASMIDKFTGGAKKPVARAPAGRSSPPL